MIIITGATGYIGRRVVNRGLKYFNAAEIFCLVNPNLNQWEKEAQKKLSKSKIKFKEADLVTQEGLRNLPRSPKLVIHLAAATDTSASDYRCNDHGTKNLYRTLKKLGPSSHLIYTGTTAIMAGRKNCSQAFDETSEAYPTNEYGRTKFRAEKFLIDKCQKDRFRLTIVRLTTVYGSNPRKNSLFDMMKTLVVKKSILSRFNWPGLTGLIHVDDVSTAIWELSKIPPLPGKPQVIILNTEVMTLAQINKLIHQALKIKYKVLLLPSLFWKVCALTKPLIYRSEKFLPSQIYNLLWRATLVVDNVIYPQNEKFKKTLPSLKFKTLQNSIKEVVLD